MRNIINSLYLMPEELEQLNIERFKPYDYIEEHEVKCDQFMVEDADVVIVAYGATARIAKNAVLAARAKGDKVGLIRPITLWPFPKKVLKEAAKTAKAMVVVEMSMGQMVDDVKLAIDCSIPVHFCGRTGGMVPTPTEIAAAIEKAKGGK
jgi:2-oxoglutarate ferredoxin oxidoreductase subunit alpha